MPSCFFCDDFSTQSTRDMMLHIFTHFKWTQQSYVDCLAYLNTNCPTRENAWFYCNSCPSISQSLRTFVCHWINHLPLQYRTLTRMRCYLKVAMSKFQCDECNMSFADNVRLMTHKINYHNVENPYQCPVCNKKLAHQSSLTRHIGVKHPRTKTTVEPEHALLLTHLSDQIYATASKTNYNTCFNTVPLF